MQGLKELLAGLKQSPVDFKSVLEFIDRYYHYRPAAFKNGDTYNEATQNQGSSKVFAIAKINQLSEADTLYLFAEHYRAVLAEPNGNDHQNIRQFIKHGWPGITFEGDVLKAK